MYAESKITLNSKELEKTVSIFYRGAIAHYQVLQNADGGFTARLMHYAGAQKNEPPKTILWPKKNNDPLSVEVNEKEIEELAMNIERQLNNSTGPETATRDLYRGENGSHHP